MKLSISNQLVCKNINDFQAEKSTISIYPQGLHINLLLDTNLKIIKACFLLTKFSIKTRYRKKSKENSRIYEALNETK